jgi:hypothetical protein
MGATKVGWVCNLLGHFWQTTHTNRWFIPTRQVCVCGGKRHWEGGPPFAGGRWVDG